MLDMLDAGHRLAPRLALSYAGKASMTATRTSAGAEMKAHVGISHDLPNLPSNRKPPPSAMSRTYTGPPFSSCGHKPN